MPKKRFETANHDRWLVSYADFITLLFAFFVILYASSKADSEKLKKVGESIEKAFGGSAMQGDLSGGNTIAPFDPTIGGSVVDLPNPNPNKIKTQEELKKMAEELNKVVLLELGKKPDAEKMQIFLDERGLVVRLLAKDFFNQSQADVRKDALPVLDKMAKILKTANQAIRIEGHTDSSKLVSEYYPSNWELSTARATWIVRYLIKKFEFDPMRLEASGMAEYHPVAPNDTEQGRAKNRRVEIIVLTKENF